MILDVSIIVTSGTLDCSFVTLCACFVLFVTSCLFLLCFSTKLSRRCDFSICFTNYLLLDTRKSYFATFLILLRCLVNRARSMAGISQHKGQDCSAGWEHDEPAQAARQVSESGTPADSQEEQASKQAVRWRAGGRMDAQTSERTDKETDRDSERQPETDPILKSTHCQGRRARSHVHWTAKTEDTKSAMFWRIRTNPNNTASPRSYTIDQLLARAPWMAVAGSRSLSLLFAPGAHNVTTVAFGEPRQVLRLLREPEVVQIPSSA